MPDRLEIPSFPRRLQAVAAGGAETEKMAKSGEHASLSRRAEAYWTQSRQPLASLVFLAPLLVAYEVGAWWLGAGNGADVFLRWLLARFGFGQHLLLPALVVCLLLALHHTSRSVGNSPAGSFPQWRSRASCWAHCCARRAIYVTSYAPSIIRPWKICATS